MRSLDDLLAEGVSGRRVLLRADLNVPLDKSTGALTDDGRIRASLPTLEALRDARELEVLTRLTSDPERPYVVVLGGSKVSDKLAVIEALLPKVDSLLIGGGMCFTFLAAQGHGVGSSLLESDQIDTCRRLLADAGDKIVLPVDVVCADRFAADAEVSSTPADAIPDDLLGLDVGPLTVELFAAG